MTTKTASGWNKALLGTVCALALLLAAPVQAADTNQQGDAPYTPSTSTLVQGGAIGAAAGFAMAELASWAICDGCAKGLLRTTLIPLGAATGIGAVSSGPLFITPDTEDKSDNPDTSVFLPTHPDATGDEGIKSIPISLEPAAVKNPPQTGNTQDTSSKPPLPPIDHNQTTGAPKLPGEANNTPPTPHTDTTTNITIIQPVTIETGAGGRACLTEDALRTKEAELSTATSNTPGEIERLREEVRQTVDCYGKTLAQRAAEASTHTDALPTPPWEPETHAAPSAPFAVEANRPVAVSPAQPTWDASATANPTTHTFTPRGASVNTGASIPASPGTSPSGARSTGNTVQPLNQFIKE